MAYIDEAQVEIVTVDYFRELGYEYILGPVIAPDGEASERADHALRIDAGARAAVGGLTEGVWM